MIAIFAIGFLFLGAAVALVIRAVTLPRVRMSAQMRQIRTYGFNPDAIEKAVPVERSAVGAGLRGFAISVGSFARTTLPQLKPLTRGELASGGLRTMPADAFHGYRVLATIGIPVLLLLDGIASGSFSAISVLLILVSGVVAWMLPVAVIRRRSQARLDLIDRQLPELIDVLTATVEAGLGFGGSLQVVANRFDAPLGEELRLTLREQTMGLSIDQALGNMVERCDTPSMRALSRAVLQGESLGVSIGQMMRSLAADTRRRRRQAATERVQKAPIKLLFPLILMIFPALLIVLLYPAVHQLLTNLGG